MLIDHIIAIADELGVPHADLSCTPCSSRAGRVLERLEALFLIDHDSRFSPPPLGVRYAHVVIRHTGNQCS